MTKTIHYCWFGGKPLSKLTKKCIKSWKEYLPDFEIKRWDETNIDINESPFIKEAYENKKWAFVADYTRCKILKEYGGIYFDTDMEITKDISDLLKEESFLGIEDSGNIAVGVWWEKNKNAFLPTYLYDFYKNQTNFNINNIYSISIPKLITNELIKYGYKNNANDIQKIKDITIYPRDYFYPMSYDGQNDIYTENTCMIHYYDATWIPKYEQHEIKYIRKYGKEKAYKILKIESLIKRIIKKCIKIVLFLFVILKRCIHESNYAKIKKQKFDEQMKTFKEKDNIVIVNPNWLGTTFATKELFGNILHIKQFNPKDNIDYYATSILEKKPNMIIFSAFELTWKKLILKIKEINPNQKIKVIWHGSNAANIEVYDFKAFNSIFNLLDNKQIDSICFVKKSMYELYKEKKYNVEFLQNTVNLKEYNYKKEQHEGIRIGLYASGDRWMKNFYNQLAGASLIKDATIDIIPLSNNVIKYSKILKCNIMGESQSIKREELLKRMSQNDINIYATFVDCAPITPLESFELGVPCITGNNHHYWENTELEKYIVVDKADNSIAIKETIELCLKNKEKVLKLYKEWKKEYDKKCEKSKKEFLSK